jgi:hypothetical protein
MTPLAHVRPGHAQAQAHADGQDKNVESIDVEAEHDPAPLKTT